MAQRQTAGVQSFSAPPRAGLSPLVLPSEKEPVPRVSERASPFISFPCVFHCLPPPKTVPTLNRHPDALIDQFQNGTGNYEIPGVDLKLNLLLHGPPGTGKSRLIRTLAYYLGRSVVSFKISQVTTAVQLQNLLDDIGYISVRSLHPALQVSTPPS